MVVNPDCGQLNRENDFFPVPVRALEFGLARGGSAVLSRVSPLLILHTRDESINIIITAHGFFSAFRDGVHLIIPSNAIGSVPSLRKI